MTHLSSAQSSPRLREEAARWQALRLDEVIDADPAARAALAVEAAGLRLDYSRQRLDPQVMRMLLSLADDCDLEQGIKRLLGGETLNNSERRPAWHSALRAEPPPAAVAEAVRDERARLRAFVEAIHTGRCVNAAGEPYTDVINIGIGGSDLGPRLVHHALQRVDSPMRAHFVGNLDSARLDQLLAGLDARRCLCVVVSKSFTTDETMRCATRVREWLSGQGGDVARQCVAVSARPQLANEFGIVNEQIFAMWDWVGGRYSLWSAVGLSTALALGWSAFESLLAGAAAMDRHFGEAPLSHNLPVIWALIAIWNRNFLGYPSQATVPYCDGLEPLPDWLQQLDMESNGKSVGRDGEVLPHACCPVQWGGVGTNVQHAFFQLLHQGDAHPVDFILPLRLPGADATMQRALLGNALAQSAALSHGRDLSGDAALSPAEQAWRHCPGNRPSSLIWLDELSPEGLGALLAAYEHRCFVQGWIWGLNSFDQFGVELGKQLARGISAGLEGDDAAWPDALLARQAQRLKSI